MKKSEWEIFKYDYSTGMEMNKNLKFSEVDDLPYDLQLKIPHQNLIIT